MTHLEAMVRVDEISLVKSGIKTPWGPSGVGALQRDSEVCRCVHGWRDRVGRG